MEFSLQQVSVLGSPHQGKMEYRRGHEREFLSYAFVYNGWLDNET